MIPDGWKYEDLTEVIASLQAGVSVNSEDRPKNDGEIGVLKVSAVTYGYFDANAYKTVLPSEVTRLQISAAKDTILVSRANTKDLVGASAYVDRDYPDLFLPDKLWQLRVKEGYAIKWLGYVLAFESIRSQISSRATGTSASMKNISQDAFLSIAVPVPTPQEQRKIAAILSTWDEAIGLVEQLIGALGRRKQALMQLLLTGVVRFPGFEGEWEKVELGEIVNLVNGRAFKPDDWRNTGLPIIRIQNLNGSSEFNYFDQDVAEKFYVDAGDLLFSWSGSRGTSFGPHLWTGTRGILNQHIFRVEHDTNVLKSYLLAVLRNITAELEHGAHGSAGLVHVTKPELESVKILLPSLPEQEKVSSVIASAEEEITLLRRELQHLQEQKRGLMQQLLTGQVRVNYGGSNV